MKKKEHCIQLKIDNLISNINSRTYENNNSQEEVNDVITLISCNHCLDLFDFLDNYSKVQKNELLFQIAFIYDMLGYNNKSLDYVNESLKMIPNAPTIILFKSGLYASMNKLEEAQKYLLKFKYLIGEDTYNNYIYNSIRIVYFYILEYEENIILREINLIETKYPKLYSNNVILFYIKSKLYQKLSEKFKKIDKIRSYLYQKESNQNKEKAINNGKLDSEYLFEKNIHKENTTKLLLMIYPNFIEYKPKPLVDYNFNFHSGFGLFLTLFKICKLFKLKIKIKAFKKMNKNFNSKKNLLKNNFENIFSLINELSQYESTNMEDSNNMKEYQESILNLSKSVWLQNFMVNKSNICTTKSNTIPINTSNKSSKIKEGKSLKHSNINFNMKNINYKLKTNYYIYKGYYSSLNLNENILKNINFNKEYKEKILGKDSLLNELDETFMNNLKDNKNNDNVILENSFGEENEDNNLKKNKKVNIEKNNGYKIKLIKSIQNKNSIKINKNNIKEKLINEKKNQLYNNYTGENKREKRKDKYIKLINKNNFNNKGSANSVNNIFNNLNKYELTNIHISRNNVKLNINTNNNQKNSENKNRTTNFSIKEKDLTIVNEIKKKREEDNARNNINKVNNKEKNNNENLYIYKINNNNINYDKHKDKFLIKNTPKNENNKDIDKFFLKKIERNEHYKKSKEKETNDKKSQTEQMSSQFNKNIDKLTITRSTNVPPRFKKNIIKYTSKPLQKKINTKNLRLEISPYNTITIKEYTKTKKNSSSKRYNNYMNYSNMNKILTDNINNKKSFFDFKTIKDNSKSENKKKNQLLIQEKVNFLTINIDLLSKTKVCTPKYQKISLFRSFSSESKEQKKKNSNKTSFSKINVNSPSYMVGLRKKFKNNKIKINYNVPKPYFTKLVNNNLKKKSLLYFNNIIGSSKLNRNKNSSFYKLEKSFTIKSNS